MLPLPEYNISDLKKYLLTYYFTSDEDVEMFITAMQQTNQLIEKDGIYRATKTLKRKYPRYVHIPPESEVTDRKSSISVFIFTYYTTKSGRMPRIAIRGGADWVKKYGVPERIVLLKIFKDGKWIDIEKPTLLITHSPRYPTTIEAFRAEIPREIVKKYGLTGKEAVYARIESIYHPILLKLWGYTITAMIFFGETKNKLNTRDLEIIGENFVYETDKNIRNTMKEKSNQVLRLMHDWLYYLDKEYCRLLDQCLIDETASISVPMEGTAPIPEKDKVERIARLIFKDVGRKAGERTIALYQTKTPFSKIPTLNDFEEVENTLIVSLREARGETKLLKRIKGTEKYKRMLNIEGWKGE